jgi:hypothetical protein
VELADARLNGLEVAEELGISPQLINKLQSGLSAYYSGILPGNWRPKIIAQESELGELEMEQWDVELGRNTIKKDYH